MYKSRSRSCVAIPLAALIIAAALCCVEPPRGASATTAAAPPRVTEPLAADDISWLFPAPKTSADLRVLIAVKDLMAVVPNHPTTQTRVWSDSAFAQFVANSDSDAGRLPGSTLRMHLPSEARKIDAWFVAGMRIDAGAPGLSQNIRDQFGQLPQIRLILQPLVIKNDNTVQVFDTAAHLIFDFTSGGLPPARPGCLPRPAPDTATFERILSDFAALRTKLETGGFAGVKIKTAGLSLGVHPGLKDPAAGPLLRDALKGILEHYLSSDRLDSMAIMTLPDGAPEPWMFLSMLHVPAATIPTLPLGGFIPVRSPALDGQTFVDALSARAGLMPVPDPSPNNLNPITCQNGASIPPLPVAGRKGLATAELFKDPPPTAERTKEIVDLIADPSRSHFFNTDCISCHTETRRAMTLLNQSTIPGVDPAVLPDDDWDVRNFGWFPEAPAVHETATRRTAAETTSVLNFINTNMLSK